MFAILVVSQATLAVLTVYLTPPIPASLNPPSPNDSSPANGK